MIKNSQIQSSESGLFIQNKLKSIKRIGKANIFSERLKKNLTKYLFNFLYIRELSDICSANIFLYNCFREYEIPNWKNEMLNIINIFQLDIKSMKEEVDESIKECIQKHRLYPMKDFPGNFIKIDNEGFNYISLVYFDPNMQFQLDKLKNLNDPNPINHFNFDALEILELDDEIDEINPLTLKTPWKIVHSKNSYKPGNIIFLEEKSSLDFGFSFNHVLKGNYKLYLHQSILNMRNANLNIQIIINDQKVFEINNFPSKKILKQFDDNEKMDIGMNSDTDINLKETYICDINDYMFDSVKNDLKKSMDIEIKNSFNSVESLKSFSTTQSLNSIISYDNNSNNRKDYTVRVQFNNKHLFWKAGWYLDGGKLVRSFN